MLPPLLSLFQNAILYPDGHLQTIWTKVITSRCGPVYIDYSGMFAEAQIYLQDRGLALLYMPLRSYNKEIFNYLSSPPSELLCPYILLEDELITYDGMGDVRTYDLILQYIPQGELLAYTPLGSDVLPMIDELEQECRRVGFSHNNLNPYNVIVSNLGQLHPIRYHFATMDGARDNFDALRAMFQPKPHSKAELNDADFIYDVGDCEIYDAHQGFIRFLKDGLYGYKDLAGNDIIPAQFIWATDFLENRAIVATQSGYGVINTAGRYIVPPEYEILYYNTDYMIFYYFEYDSVVGFDYNGRPLEPDDYRFEHLLKYRYTKPPIIYK